MTPEEEMAAMSRSLTLAFTHIATFIEDGRLKNGSAVTSGVAEVEIDGKWYEIQLRMEGNRDHFVGPDELFSSMTLGGTVTLS